MTFTGRPCHLSQAQGKRQPTPVDESVTQPEGEGHSSTATPGDRRSRPGFTGQVSEAPAGSFTAPCTRGRPAPSTCWSGAWGLGPPGRRRGIEPGLATGALLPPDYELVPPSALGTAGVLGRRLQDSLWARRAHRTETTGIRGQPRGRTGGSRPPSRPAEAVGGPASAKDSGPPAEQATEDGSLGEQVGSASHVHKTGRETEDRTS